MCGGRLREASHQGYMDPCLYEQLRQRNTHHLVLHLSPVGGIRRLPQAYQLTRQSEKGHGVSVFSFWVVLHHHQGESKGTIIRYYWHLLSSEAFWGESWDKGDQPPRLDRLFILF
jgi:hypothetical protein